MGYLKQKPKVDVNLAVGTFSVVLNSRISSAHYQQSPKYKEEEIDSA